MEASYQQSDLTSSRELSSDKSQTKSITRKPNTNLFKKNKDTNPSISRDKKYRSTENIRFLKSSHREDSTAKKIPKYQQQNQQALTKTTPTLTESHQLTLIPPRPLEELASKSLVFNKFTLQQKQKVRDYLVVLKDLNRQPKHQQALSFIISNVRQYIEQLQDNNAKLLEVNYFFQKEFNRHMQDKERLKKVEKCNKNYCLECRYHLEKENKWKQEKKEMNDQLTHLRSVISSKRGQSTCSLNNSIILEHSNYAASNFPQALHKDHHKQQLQQLTDMILQKDEEYLVLLNQYNFLDSINKDLKDRHAKLMDLYKYLSIENRTLLAAKGKLAQKQLECARIKSQRDQFKKRIIEFHRRIQKERDDKEEQEGTQLCKDCKDQQEKGEFGREESIFTLSSISTDQHRQQLQQTQPY